MKLHKMAVEAIAQIQQFDYENGQWKTSVYGFQCTLF
jgi:hypothetical protein